MSRETSADVASIAGELATITAADLAMMSTAEAEMVAAKIRSVAASALGQRADAVPDADPPEREGEAE